MSIWRSQNVSVEWSGLCVVTQGKWSKNTDFHGIQRVCICNFFYKLVFAKSYAGLHCFTSILQSLVTGL